MLRFCLTNAPEGTAVREQKEDFIEEKAAQKITDDILQSLIAAQERELGKIARELHDDICQRLAMLSLKIEKTAKAWATGQQQIGDQLVQIWQQCCVLTGDVQALSHELHPSTLENLGLVAAARSFCRELSEQCGAVIDFTDKNVPDSLPLDVSLALFRLIQEALHNSVKYSGESHFQVHLEGHASGIRLMVRDQGVGFDLAKVMNKRGLGLISMRERIQLLHGNIHIDSKPDRGTRIRAWLPLRTNSEVWSNTKWHA
jgi:signal transduction histidine kinase